jgi:hypothetical protein
VDSKSILRACVILRDAVRNDPAVTGLELAVSAEAVLVTTIAVDGAKQSAPVMGEAAAAKYLAPACTPRSANGEANLPVPLPPPARPDHKRSGRAGGCARLFPIPLIQKLYGRR